MRLSYCPKCGYKKKRGQRPRIVYGSTNVQVYGSHSAAFEICRGCGFQFYVSYPFAHDEKNASITFYKPEIWEPAKVTNKRVAENRRRRFRHSRRHRTLHI